MTIKKIGPLLVILIVSLSNIHLLTDIYAETAYSNITLAENKISSAFQAIHLAEIEGADIRFLVYKLNNAIDLLSLLDVLNGFPGQLKSQSLITSIPGTTWSFLLIEL